MNKRQPIHENSDVVSVLANTFNLVLVEYLNTVVVDVLLVDQVDVLALTVISLENSNVVFLESTSLLDDAVLLARDAFSEEALPLCVAELNFVKLLYLYFEVRY